MTEAGWLTCADGNRVVFYLRSGSDRKLGLVAMTKRAKRKGFPFAYLSDATQEVTRKYGAMYTPEFFVLNKDRKVVYTGAMDDKAPPGEAKVKHLEAAVKAVLDGKKIDTTETSAAAGCKIKIKEAKKDEDK